MSSIVTLAMHCNMQHCATERCGYMYEHRIQYYNILLGRYYLIVYNMILNIEYTVFEC